MVFELYFKKRLRERVKGGRETYVCIFIISVSLRLVQEISCLRLLPVVRTMPEPNITLSVLEEHSSTPSEFFLCFNLLKHLCNDVEVQWSTHM